MVSNVIMPMSALSHGAEMPPPCSLPVRAAGMLQSCCSMGDTSPRLLRLMSDPGQAVLSRLSLGEIHSKQFSCCSGKSLNPTKLWATANG